jgi:hypothetical protein
MPIDPKAVQWDTPAAIDPSAVQWDDPSNNGATRAVLRQAVGVNPEHAAEASRLARRYPAPEDVLLRNLKDVQLQEAVDIADDRLLTSPKLEKALRDISFARKAHDDIPNLAELESAISRFGEWKPTRGPDASFSSVTKGIAQAFPQGFRQMNEGLGLQVSDLFDEMGATPDPVLKADRLRRIGQEQARVDTSTPDFESATARGLYGGGTSLMRQVPGIVASLLLRNTAPMLATAGLQVEGEAYGKYRERGATPGEATIGAVGEAAVEIATEKLPMSFLVDKFGKTGAKQFLAGMLVREVPGEQVATFLQDAIDTAVANPEKTWEQFAAERPAAAYQTLLATIVQSGVMGSANAVATKLAGPQERADRAEQGAQQAEALAKIAEASKLRERDAPTFKAYVEKLAEEGDAPTELYVDGTTLANSLSQSGVTIAEFEAVAPVAARQLANAVATGVDVRIPVAEFATAGDAVTAPLIDHLRTTEDAMSRAEAAEFLKEQGDAIQAQVEQQMMQREALAEQQQGVEKVREHFETELNNAKRFTPDVNKAYASLLSSFYGAQASRLGMTPEALLQRYGLKITAQAGQQKLTQEDRGALDFGDDITAAQSVMRLLQGADLTTAIHESGHFFLEVQADMAMRIGETQADPAALGIVNDMDTLLGWFGVKGGLDEWSHMTLEQKRSHHEQFARGFEAFAMEGKAPSVELQGIFQRFRSWLVNVYKQLTNLNVTLNDDVRAVMGRMIASDLAIEQAEAQRNMGPLFKDGESAGMTPEEYTAYQALASKATEAAVDALQTRALKDMKWLSRARDKALKARQQEVDELRREVKNEVRVETMAEPVYQAWQFLTGKQDQVAPGEQAAEDVDTVQQSGRLRTQVLRDMYGTDETAVWRKLSAKRMTSDTSGMHPEIVAEMFGYDSADAMVKALAAAMPPAEVIDARTDQRMLEMFGDIGSEEALARAVDEAVHNEVRARFIAAELKALQAANTVREKRGRNSVDVMARAAKAYAEQIIARLTVRDIRPGQYAAAEARNAKQAEKAFAAGKLEEAATHKRNQLVNNYATRAAYEAQDEIKKAAAYFRKFDKRSKSVDAAYLDQIEAMLERFNFRPASLKEADRRKSLSAWVEDQRALGVEPSIDPDLLNEANRKSYKDMTLEEIRGLRDAVKQIEHLGRLKNKLMLARDQREFDAIADEMAASIIEHGGKARPVKLEGEKGVIPWLQGVAASHRKLASLFRQMDGGSDHGPLYQQIGRAMNERGTMEETMIEQATVALRDLYAPIMKLKGGTAGGKVYIPAINASLSRGGRLSIALNWGNESNRQRIMSGDGWSEAQVNAILKTLTPTELEFVNGVWAYIDTYWEQIAAKEKRLTGVAPDKVEASPFTVTAADGSQVQMRGGYYPLKYDSDRSDRAASQEAAQVAQEMMQGAFTRATTRRGHTKARMEEVSRPVRKDLNVITQHITQVVHDLAWHEWLIDTNRLLSDERIVTAIRDHYGPPVLKTMRDDVMGIATADVAGQTDIDKALLVLRSNVTRATMGASLTTAFLQPFGLTQSIVRIGPKHVLRGLARWGGDASRMESSLGWIREKSEFMRLRAKTFNRELREIRGSVEGKSAAMQAVDGGLFWLMRKMQAVADVPTWIGQYEKSLAEGLDEDAAIAQADRAVLESQGGGQTKDLAEVQRKHPMLTQFYSYFSVTLNLTAERTAATDFKNPRAVAGWLGDMALLQVIPAILPSFILYSLRGGDEDDEKGWAKKIAEWQAGYLLGNIVGLRELSGLLSGFDYAGPPVGRIVSDTGKAGKQTLQGELDEPAVLAYARLMGDAFGIPVTQAIRSYKGWKAWDEGEAGPQAVLFGPPPQE